MARLNYGWRNIGAGSIRLNGLLGWRALEMLSLRTLFDAQVSRPGFAAGRKRQMFWAVVMLGRYAAHMLRITGSSLALLSE